MRLSHPSVAFLLILGGAVFALFMPDAEAGVRTLPPFLRPRPLAQRHIVALSDRVVALGVEPGESVEPGAQPLSPALEQRLERYMANDNCPVTLDRVIHERCQFLLKQSRQLLSKKREGARISPRAGGTLRTVERGTVIRRTIGGEYQRRLRSAADALYLRQQEGGFRQRLRTLQDAQKRYSGVTIERSRGETRLRQAVPPSSP